MFLDFWMVLGICFLGAEGLPVVVWESRTGSECLGHHGGWLWLGLWRFWLGGFWDFGPPQPDWLCHNARRLSLRWSRFDSGA